MQTDESVLRIYNPDSSCPLHRPQKGHPPARKRLLQRAGPPRAALAPSVLEDLEDVL